jgi:hypothetical protein
MRTFARKETSDEKREEEAQQAVQEYIEDQHELQRKFGGKMH